MKIKLSNAEADKIILKKIVSLQKLKKKIKVDRSEKFITTLFQLFKDIQDITKQGSDYFEDDSQLTFSLYAYTNVNLSLFSDTRFGCNYGIGSFQIEKHKTIVHVEDRFYEIKNENQMKEYFSQNDMILPIYIEIMKLNFTAVFEKTTTQYNFIN